MKLTLLFLARLALLLALIIFILWLLSFFSPRTTFKHIGTTFSSEQAQALGLSPEETLDAILGDLGMRHIRLSAYWKDVEPEQDKYSFRELDWQLELARKYNAEVILGVGRKLPRWPECHDPQWLFELVKADRLAEQREYVSQVVERYRGSKEIVMWEIENEPFLPYGHCPEYDRQFIDEEIAVVHELDPTRPILVTDSGELSVWVLAAKRGDVFGTTMYRTVYNRYFGQFEYPIPPWFFRSKQTLTRWITQSPQMIIIELQGEPWDSEPYATLSLERQYNTMSPEMFKNTFEYAERTGFDTVYTWGAEWWYSLKLKGHPEIWEYMKKRISGGEV